MRRRRHLIAPAPRRLPRARGRAPAPSRRCAATASGCSGAPRNRAASAAAAPARSLPAIGWAPTNGRSAGSTASHCAHHLALHAADVGDHRPRPQVRRAAAARPPRCCAPAPRARRDRPAPRSAGSRTVRSTMPRAPRHRQVGLAAADADHLADQAGRARRQRQRAADQSDADDRRALKSQRRALPRASTRAQRRHQPLVLRARADRHPHVLGEAVHRHRPHDDAETQQLVVELRRVADPHQDEVRPARHALEAEVGEGGAAGRPCPRG